MATDTKLDSLVINYLTQAQYDNAKSEGTLNSNQIYMTPASSGTHTLPAATSSTLGGVKIGSNITVNSGTISISKTNVTNALGYTPPMTDTKYTLPTASAWTLGGVKIGSNITENSGTISLTKANAIVVALITGGLSLIGVIITNLAGQRRTEQRMATAQAVTDTKIEELTREVRAHNNFAQRVPVLEEQIKVANHRITDLENKTA